MNRILPLAALVLIPSAAQAQRPATDSATIAAVADSIAAEVLKAPVAGAAVAVAVGDRVVYRKAYGFADVAARTPLTLADPHQIG